MQGVRPTRSTKLLERQFFGGGFPVLRRCVVFPFALIACKTYQLPHDLILLMTGVELLNDLGNHTGADRAPPFANREL